MWVVGKKTSPSPKKHFILFSLLLWPASVQIQERGWELVALPNNMRGQHKQKENKLRHIIKVMRDHPKRRFFSLVLCVVRFFIFFWTLRTHHYVNELFCILKQEKEESTEKKTQTSTDLLPPLHAEKIEKKRWSKVVNKIVGPHYIHPEAIHAMNEGIMKCIQKEKYHIYRIPIQQQQWLADYIGKCDANDRQLMEKWH